MVHRWWLNQLGVIKFRALGNQKLRKEMHGSLRSYYRNILIVIASLVSNSKSTLSSSHLRLKH